MGSFDDVPTGNKTLKSSIAPNVLHSYFKRNFRWLDKYGFVDRNHSSHIIAFKNPDGIDEQHKVIAQTMLTQMMDLYGQVYTDPDFVKVQGGDVFQKNTRLLFALWRKFGDEDPEEEEELKEFFRKEKERVG